MSAYLNQRSANLGSCTQPCRFDYKPYSLLLEEQSRPDLPLWELVTDDNYSHILTADDLCLIRYLKWFICAGINCIKIEGRTKTGPYVARVADVYKTALIDAANNQSRLPLYLDELAQIGSRRLTTGLFLGGPKVVAEHTKPSHPIVAQIVKQITTDKWLLQIKSIWEQEKPIRLMLPGLQRPIIKPQAYSMETATGNQLTIAHSGMAPYLRLTHPQLKPGMYLIQ